MMNPSALRPFDPLKEPDRLRQTLGCVLAPDRWYAVVRPDGAEPSDREDRLILRDDAFGAELMQMDLDMHWPTAMTCGHGLVDPVDAIMVTFEGSVLMLRDGLMRVEEVPSAVAPNAVGNPRGSLTAVAVGGGGLFVSGSDGLLARRLSDAGGWQDLHHGIGRFPDILSLSALAVDGEGMPLAAGHRDYAPRVLGPGSDGTRGVRETSLDGSRLTGVAAAGPSDFVLVSSRGRVWRGHPDTGLAIVAELSTSLDDVAVFRGAVFIADADGGIWQAQGDGFLRGDPLGGNRLHGMRFDVHGDRLWVQGENGFALYDGEVWTRIAVPW